MRLTDASALARVYIGTRKSPPAPFRPVPVARVVNGGPRGSDTVGGGLFAHDEMGFRIHAGKLT